MNSLTTQYRRSQLVALPVTGGKGPVQFVYGVRVQGAVEPVSYPFAEWVVGDFNSQAATPMNASAHSISSCAITESLR